MTGSDPLLAAARRYAEQHGGLCGQEAWGVWAAQERAAGREAPSFKIVRRLYGNMAVLADDDLRQAVESSEADIAAGRTVPWADVKKELGLDAKGDGNEHSH